MFFYTLILQALIAVFLFLFIFMLIKGNTLSFVFSLFSLLVAVYIFGVLGQLKSSSIEEAKFYQQIKYVGVPMLISLFALFLYKYKNYRFPNYIITFFLILIPIIITFIVFTNDYHGLYYRNFTYKMYQGYFILQFERGPLSIIPSLFNLSFLAYYVYVLIALIKQNKNKNTLFISSLLVSVFVLAFLALAHALNLIESGVDFTPLAYVFQAVVFIVAIFRYKILDVGDLYDNHCIELKEGVIVVDENFNLIYFNRPSSKVFSWLNNNVIGKSVLQYENFFNKPTNNLKEDFIEIETDGVSLYYELKKNEIIKKNKKIGYLYLITENTNEIRLRKNLEFLAKHDGLTKIYNPIHTLEKLEQKLIEAKTNKENLIVAMLDINNFKTINDKYGHLIGNDILVNVAQTIYDVFRPYNYNFGRFGGDEFIIVGIPKDDGEIIKLFDLLINKSTNFNEKTFVNDSPFYSIGITKVKGEDINDELHYDDILKKADLLMYEAKSKSKNYIIK